MSSENLAEKYMRSSQIFHKSFRRSNNCWKVMTQYQQPISNPCGEDAQFSHIQRENSSVEVYSCFRGNFHSSDINNPTTPADEEEKERLQRCSLHRNQKKPPSICERVCHGRGIHSPAYSLPQHPPAIPSKINTVIPS